MKAARKNALIVTATVLYPLASVALFFQGNWYSFFHSYSLAMFFGLVSYCYFAVALVLGSRVKALDRVFGHDRILIFHGIIAGLALACAIPHAILKKAYFTEDTMQSRMGSMGLVIFLFVILMTVLLMLETPLDRIPFFSSITRFLKKHARADYTLLKLLHNFAAPAFAIIVLHVLLASPVRETGAKTAFAAITGLLAVACYAYHKIVRPLISLLNAHSVTSVKKLSDGIIEIEMTPRKGRTMRHKAGQFAFFRFFDKTCGVGEHPFTISSSPSASARTVTVKALGDFTAKLGALRVNATCLVDGPYGLFYPKHDDRELLFIAGGIGITPFLSILRDFSEKSRVGAITLLWSVRRKDEAFAREELGTIASRLPDFRFRVLVTGEPSFEKQTADGRIDESMIQDALARFGSPKNVTAFICGPDSFRRSAQTLLKKSGIQDKNVVFEAFSF